jgi:hypothetical protein
MADVPNASSLQVDTLMEANWLQWRPAMTARLHQRGLWRVTMGESLPPSKPTLFEPVAPATTLSRTEESHNYAAQRDYQCVWRLRRRHFSVGLRRSHVAQGSHATSQGHRLLILGYLVTLDSLMYLCSDVVLCLESVMCCFLPSCTKCQVALIM